MLVKQYILYRDVHIRTKRGTLEAAGMTEGFGCKGGTVGSYADMVEKLGAPWFSGEYNPCLFWLLALELLVTSQLIATGAMLVASLDSSGTPALGRRN